MQFIFINEKLSVVREIMCDEKQNLEKVTEWK